MKTKKRSPFIGCAALLLVLATATRADDGQQAIEPWSPEQREVVQAINAYSDAWNDGDAERMAALCTLDCDRIGGRGQKLEGRAGILEHYRTAFATPPPEGVTRSLAYEITSVRMVSDQLAIVDARYRVIGLGPIPDRPFEGLNTVVLVKENGKWLRTAHRNWIPPRQEKPSLDMMCLTFGLVSAQSAARSEDRRNFLFKQCNEDVLALRVDPAPIQEFVGPEFTLALEDGKAKVAIIVQDCSQYWIDGENLGATRHAHVWVEIEGPRDVRPVVGAQLTLPTMTWFSLSAGSTNPRDHEARKKSGTSPDPIEEVVLDLSESQRGGRVVFDDGLSYSWEASSEKSDAGLAAAISSARLVGVNHIIYVRDSSGKLVVKRVQALVNLAAGPNKGMLHVTGGTYPSRLIGSGEYPVLVYTFLPVWAQATLGEEL